MGLARYRRCVVRVRHAPARHMNARTFTLFICFAVRFSFAQGTFQNLNFENATVVPIPNDPSGHIQFTPAFPGWTGYLGGSGISLVNYNSLNIGSSGIGLLDPGYPGGSRIAGNYTAVLQAGQLGFQPDASMAQRGLIPAGTMSLHFFAGEDFRGGVVASIDGQALNLSVLQTFSGYNELGADISAFAGQTVELRFTRPAVVAGANLFLDDISFSPNPVPEPSAWVLLVLGSALFWCVTRRWRK